MGTAMMSDGGFAPWPLSATSGPPLVGDVGLKGRNGS